MTFRRLEKAHLDEVLSQQINWLEREYMDETMINFILELPSSVSVFYKDRLMLCGGTIPLWKNRAHLWTVFSKDAGDNFLPVFRAIKTYINAQPYNRLELCVPYNFDIGKKRARVLGFQLECGYARNYLPDGRDCALFSYIKGVT